MDQHEYDVECCKLRQQHDEIIYQQVNMLGQAALKSALLINGGASVAMLAFIGTAINNPEAKLLLSKLCFSMLLFVSGTLVAAIASGVTYLTGYVSGNEYIKAQPGEKQSKWFLILNGIAIILVIVGYGLFLWGSWNAYCAFTNSLS